MTRDIDILKQLAEVHAASVIMSITSLRPEISKVMEPRASVPQARLKAVEELTKAGIPVHVNLAPVIPGLTDQEILTGRMIGNNYGYIEKIFFI